MGSIDQIAVNSPKLKRVVAHWYEARGTRLMPAWQDIRPAQFKAALPVVWSFQYDATEDDFVGRLAGDEIQRLLGGPIKNTRFRQVYNSDYSCFFARAKQVLFGPALFLGRGLLFRQRERQCYGERIVLPFSSEDGHTKGIFGATDFQFSFPLKAGPELCGEVEHWFDLSVIV